MQLELSTWTPPGERPQPPPLWLVSDGLRTAGPLSTTALVGSAAQGLSRRLYVKHHRTPIWRRVGELREVRAVDESAFERARRMTRMRSLHGLEALLRLSEGPAEPMALGLDVAALRLGATFGFVHRFERGRSAPVTRWAFGPGASGRIGAPLLRSDTMLAIACSGKLAMGDARLHHAFRVAGSRLGGRQGEVIGVAMIPLVTKRGMQGILELGRVDHPFRTADTSALRAVGALVGERLAASS